MPQAETDPQLRSGDAPDDGGVAALTAAVARGDSDALSHFYEAWFDRCLAMARALTKRDESFCLDVVQDAMLRVARSMRRIETRPELERWMTRVVHTAAIDLLRRESRRMARERRRTHAVGAGEQAHVDDRVQWLRDQLDGLGPEERTLLTLRFVQGNTLEQTGQALGMSGDAMHGKLRRIIQRLRRAAPKEQDHE